jgi:CHAT domain-containing protein
MPFIFEERWNRPLRHAVAPILFLGLLTGCQPPPSPIEQVHTLAGPNRGLRGRLKSDLPYRPFENRQVGRLNWIDSALATKSLVGFEREIKAAALDDPGWEQLNDLGVLHSICGDHDSAIATLRAAADQSSETRPYNDLAVAYLARFERQEEAVDLLLAAAASTTALALDPLSREALFNQALTFSLLGLRHGAAAAWKSFTDVETDPAWLEEAATIAANLDHLTIDAAWDQKRVELENHPARWTAPEIKEIVAAFPFHTRTYTEETLLPRWARLVEKNPGQAAVWLTLGGHLAKTLEHQRGEGLTHDAVLAAAQTWNVGSMEQRHLLLEGLRRFERGVAAYRHQDTAKAERLLRQAAEELTAVSNPLAGWARFYSAVCRRYNDAAAGHATLEDLLADVPERYLALAGRAQWILGTTEKVRGQVQSSIHRSETALDLLHRSSGAAGSAFVHVLLAESLSMLGKHDQGWAHRYQAFLEVPVIGNLRRGVAMWTEAALALRRQGALSLAGPLLDEAVAVAQQWRQPIGLCSAYFHRAKYRIKTGDEQGAFDDIEKAHEATAEMEPGGLRDQMYYLTLVAEGLLYRESQPERTVALLSEAFALQDSTGYQFSLIDHLTPRASSYSRLGDHDAAESDLMRAIEFFEKIRSTVEDPFTRMQAFRVAQPAFEDLLKLRLDTKGGIPGSLFGLAERARARVLFDLLRQRKQGAGQSRDFATLKELEQALPEGTVVVEFMLLPDQLLCWIVEPGTSRLLKLRTEPEEIRRDLESLLLDLKRKAPEKSIRHHGAKLYESLVRPLGLPPHEGSTLVIVPDRFLSRMPWLALFNREDGRYLVEERPISVLPSATLLLSVLEETELRRVEAPSILAIGVSKTIAFERHVLPPLPHALTEASEVTHGYAADKALVHTGPLATQRSFIVRSPEFNVIHFAGHALADGEVITRSVLLFQPQDDSDTGALTLSRILRLQLDRTQLVVLSACQTLQARADDREAMLGLGGAFLASGVPAVVASQWDVRDSYAAQLMPLFHQRFAAGASASAALRQAVLTLISMQSTNPPTPADWANFMVLGGTGR